MSVPYSVRVWHLFLWGCAEVHGSVLDMSMNSVPYSELLAASREPYVQLLLLQGDVEVP